MTPLHVSNFSSVSLPRLRELGADAKIILREAHVKVVKALLAAGADTEAKMKGGKTPRDVAKNQRITRLLEG